jgi:hypothetical protein
MIDICFVDYSHLMSLRPKPIPNQVPGAWLQSRDRDVVLLRLHTPSLVCALQSAGGGSQNRRGSTRSSVERGARSEQQDCERQTMEGMAGSDSEAWSEAVPARPQVVGETRKVEPYDLEHPRVAHHGELYGRGEQIRPRQSARFSPEWQHRTFFVERLLITAN